MGTYSIRPNRSGIFFISCLQPVLLKRIFTESLLALAVTHSASRGNCQKSDLCETTAELPPCSTKSSLRLPFPEYDLLMTITESRKAARIIRSPQTGLLRKATNTTGLGTPAPPCHPNTSTASVIPITPQHCLVPVWCFQDSSHLGARLAAVLCLF